MNFVFLPILKPSLGEIGDTQIHKMLAQTAKHIVIPSQVLVTAYSGSKDYVVFNLFSPIYSL